MLPLGVFVVAAFVSACASSGSKAATAGSGCELRPQDSTFAMHIPLYRECAVDRKAQLLTTNISPEYRPSNPGNACFSAEVEYVITADGHVDGATARVLRTTTPAYGEAVLAVLPRYRFEPAKVNGAPVAQITWQKFEAISKVVAVVAGTRPNPGRAGPGC
ncbi:MAG: hypothetical protein ABI664_11575 [bacterium]